MDELTESNIYPEELMTYNISQGSELYLNEVIAKLGGEENSSIKEETLNNTKKPEETKKPAEKRKTFEASKNAMAERIKNMEASNNDKKQEKKEETKKLNNNNFLNKLKQFQPGEQKKENKENLS